MFPPGMAKHLSMAIVVEMSPQVSRPFRERVAIDFSPPAYARLPFPSGTGSPAPVSAAVIIGEESTDFPSGASEARGHPVKRLR